VWKHRDDEFGILPPRLLTPERSDGGQVVRAGYHAPCKIPTGFTVEDRYRGCFKIRQIATRRNNARHTDDSSPASGKLIPVDKGCEKDQKNKEYEKKPFSRLHRFIPLHVVRKVNSLFSLHRFLLISLAIVPSTLCAELPYCRHLDAHTL
jgi:hypothetical protein